MDLSILKKTERLQNIGASIQDEAPHVKLLAIVINHETRTGQKSVLEMIAFYEELFGAEMFWELACVIVTHFSNSPEQR